MEALKEMEYSPDGSGLKEYIFDTFNEEPEDEKTDNLVEQVRGFIKRNPDTVNMSIDALSSIVKTVTKNMGKHK
jgi:hypothetical protein